MDFGSVIIIMLIIILFSSILRATFGFGDAIIAMPLLSLCLDLKTATPFYALVALTISFIIFIQTFNRFKVKDIIRLLISTFIAIPIGVFIVKEANENIIKIILGLIIILFSFYNLIKPNIFNIKNRIFPYFFGFIAGILGGAYNVNGPPVVFYASFKKWDPQIFRSSLQTYFFFTGIVLIISHMIFGNMTSFVIQSYIVTIPILLFGIFIGTKIHHNIPVDNFKKYVYIFLIILGVLLVLNSIIQL